MSEPLSATITEATPSSYGAALRRLYAVRFVFAVIWAGVLFTTSSTTGAFLTTWLALYPLFDAGAVLWQLRADPSSRSRTIEWINVVASLAVALVVGIASTSSIAAALVVWGAWAIASGIPQLVTAVRNRHTGGQVPQMLSGGISVLAGCGFLMQGLDDADDLAGAGGYAILGGIFFLASAIRLSLRRSTT